MKIRRTWFVRLSALVFCASFLQAGAYRAQAAPSLEEYVKSAGPGVKVIAVGKMKIDGIRAICGRRPTVLNPNFDDYGGAYPGYLILNPKKMKGLPTAVKFYIYSHECGHQFIGIDESAADCFAVKRGRRYGWLRPDGMEQICKFMWSHKGDSAHLPGPKRCKLMKKCYDEAAPKRAKKK